jgi:hypothetical protein
MQLTYAYKPQASALGSTTEGAKELLKFVAEQLVCTGVPEPQGGALHKYYGYYVDTCDKPGEDGFPSRLIMGSVGKKKDVHVWHRPGYNCGDVVQSTPTKQEKALKQRQSYDHVTIRSAGCAMLVDPDAQLKGGVLCSGCKAVKTKLQKKAAKQQDPRKPASAQANISTFSPAQLGERVQHLQRTCKNLTQKCKRLIKRWCDSLEEAPPSQVQEIYDLHMEHKDKFFQEFSKDTTPIFSGEHANLAQLEAVLFYFQSWAEESGAANSKEGKHKFIPYGECFYDIKLTIISVITFIKHYLGNGSAPGRLYIYTKDFRSKRIQFL